MIVIYKEDEYPIKTLKNDQKYLVRTITGSNIELFNIRGLFDKSKFTDEDGNEIKLEKYTNKYIITRKNIEKGDRVLCVDSFNDRRLGVGSVYKVEDVVHYMDKTFKLDLVHAEDFIPQSGWIYTSLRSIEFTPNAFIKFNKATERYIKYLKIFDDIDVLKTE
jgi:hypothetical protein